MGERAACAYLLRRGFTILARNVRYKTGELDIVASREGRLHIVEVKAASCHQLPSSTAPGSGFDPAQNLHAFKLQKLVRTAQWHVVITRWGGDWQIDAAVVWLREEDNRALVRYYPQIL